MEIKEYQVSQKIQVLGILSQYPEMFGETELDLARREFSKPHTKSHLKYVAINNDRVVGVVSATGPGDSEHIWFLTFIAVSSKMARRGIGKALLTWIEGEVAGTTRQRIFLDTLFSSSDVSIQARKFYINCEYCEVGVIPNYWGKGQAKVFFFKDLSKG